MFTDIIDIRIYLTNIQTPHHLVVSGVYCVYTSSWGRGDHDKYLDTYAGLPLNTKHLIMLALIRYTVRGLVKEIRFHYEAP